MKGTVKLKHEKTSKKFGVVFPADTELNCFMDDELRLYVEHPRHKGVHMEVGSFEQYDLKYNK